MAESETTGIGARLNLNDFCCVRNRNVLKRSDDASQDGDEAFLHPAYWVGQVSSYEGSSKVKIIWLARNPFVDKLFIPTTQSFVEAADDVLDFRAGLEWNDNLQGYVLVRDINACLSQRPSSGGSGPDEAVVRSVLADLKRAPRDKEPRTPSRKVEDADDRRLSSASGTSSTSPKSLDKKSESDSPASEGGSDTTARIGSEYQAEIPDKLTSNSEAKEEVRRHVVLTCRGDSVKKEDVLYFGSILSGKDVSMVPPVWTQAEKVAFEKAIYKHMSFRKISEEVATLMKLDKPEKTTSNCVQYFYDGFYKSRSYAAWERHRDKEIEKAERLRLEADRVKTRQRRQRVAASRKNKDQAPSVKSKPKEADKGSPSSRRGRGKTIKTKRVRKKPLSILATERNIKTLCRKEKPWCSPDCEFMPARISEVEIYDISSDEDCEVYCVCNGANAGTMVLCSGCSNWYHAACVGLRKDMLSEHSVFRCEKCAVFAVGIHKGPELERPATWIIKAQRGESAFIDIIALKPLKVNGPCLKLEDVKSKTTGGLKPITPSSDHTDSVVRLQKGTFGRVVSVPKKKNYVLLLGQRSVAVWDREHKQLIAGSAAPTVSSLETYLLNNPLKKPWHGSIRRNNAATPTSAAKPHSKLVKSPEVKPPPHTLASAQSIPQVQKPLKAEAAAQPKSGPKSKYNVPNAKPKQRRDPPLAAPQFALSAEGLEKKRKQKILEKEQLMLAERRRIREEKRKEKKRPAPDAPKTQRKKEKTRKKQASRSIATPTRGTPHMPPAMGQHLPPPHMMQHAAPHMPGHPPFYRPMGGVHEDQYAIYLRQQHMNQMQYMQSLGTDARPASAKPGALRATLAPHQGGADPPANAPSGDEDGSEDLSEGEVRTRLQGRYHAQRLQLQYSHQQQMQQLQYQQHQQLQRAYSPAAQMQLSVVHSQEQQMLAASHQQQIIRFDQEIQRQVRTKMDEQKANQEKRAKRKEKEREMRTKHQHTLLRQQEEQRQQMLQSQIMQQQIYQQQLAMHQDVPRPMSGIPDASRPSHAQQDMQHGASRPSHFGMYDHLAPRMVSHAQFQANPYATPASMPPTGRPMGGGVMHPMASMPMGGVPTGQPPVVNSTSAKAGKLYGRGPLATKPKKMVACEYPGCTKTYTQRHNLLTHMRKKHGYRDDARSASARPTVQGSSSSQKQRY